MLSKRRTQVLSLLRYGWPVLALLAFLWFPFDWLSTVWPTYGNVFNMIFRSDREHFIGHTLLFLLVGSLILAYVPPLRYKFHWYLVGLVLVALTQEAIQAIFRGQIPTFTDTNAFKGDALGGISAFVIWTAIIYIRQVRHNRLVSSQ
jgi:hypothetical protein